MVRERIGGGGGRYSLDQNTTSRSMFSVFQFPFIINVLFLFLLFPYFSIQWFSAFSPFCLPKCASGETSHLGHPTEIFCYCHCQNICVSPQGIWKWQGERKEILMNAYYIDFPTGLHGVDFQNQKWPTMQLDRHYQLLFACCNGTNIELEVRRYVFKSVILLHAIR